MWRGAGKPPFDGGGSCRAASDGGPPCRMQGLLAGDPESGVYVAPKRCCSGIVPTARPCHQAPTV